jgi:HJR/Mrr/RecB family endonuclease
VQEALGARHYCRADYAMVVANSGFTPGAVDLARASTVDLWDISKLSELPRDEHRLDYR